MIECKECGKKNSETILECPKKCGYAENEKDAKFCDCGEKLPDATRCDGCGSPLFGEAPSENEQTATANKPVEQTEVFRSAEKPVKEDESITVDDEPVKETTKTGSKFSKGIIGAIAGVVLLAGAGAGCWYFDVFGGDDNQAPVQVAQQLPGSPVPAGVPGSTTPQGVPSGVPAGVPQATPPAVPAPAPAIQEMPGTAPAPVQAVAPAPAPAPKKEIEDFPVQTKVKEEPVKKSESVEKFEKKMKAERKAKKTSEKSVKVAAVAKAVEKGSGVSVDATLRAIKKALADEGFVAKVVYDDGKLVVSAPSAMSKSDSVRVLGIVKSNAGEYKDKVVSKIWGI